jgi:hypothetical protein
MHQANTPARADDAGAGIAVPFFSALAILIIAHMRSKNASRARSFSLWCDVECFCPRSAVFRSEMTVVSVFSGDEWK